MQKSNNYKPIDRFIPHRIKDSEGDFSARMLMNKLYEEIRARGFEVIDGDEI